MVVVGLQIMRLCGICISTVAVLVSVEHRGILLVLLILFQSQKELVGGVLHSVVYGSMYGYNGRFINDAISRPFLLNHDRQCIVIIGIIAVIIVAVARDRPLDLVHHRKASGCVMDSKVIPHAERHGPIRQGQPRGFHPVVGSLCFCLCGSSGAGGFLWLSTIILKLQCLVSSIMVGRQIPNASEVEQLAWSHGFAGWVICQLASDDSGVAASIDIDCVDSVAVAGVVFHDEKWMIGILVVVVVVATTNVGFSVLAQFRRGQAQRGHRSEDCEFDSGWRIVFCDPDMGGKLGKRSHVSTPCRC